VGLFPPGHRLQQAVRWISDRLRTDPETAVQPLVREAISRFDLTPKEGEELVDFYRKASAPQSEPD